MRYFGFILWYSKLVFATLTIPSDPGCLKEYVTFLNSFVEIRSQPCNIILVYEGDEETKTDLANWILSKTEYPWVLEDLDTISPFSKRNMIKLSFVSTIKSFTEKVGNISTFLNFNTRQKIVFFICNKIDDVYAVRVLEDIWNVRILNFLLIYCNRKLGILSYNPFMPEKIVNFTDKSVKFDGQKLMNLNGFELVLSMFDEYPRLNYDKKVFYGRDVRLMAAMMNLMGARTEIIRTDNGSWLGIFEDLILGRAEFSLIDGFLTLLDEYEDFLTFTYPFRINGFAVIVPKAGAIPQYLHIFLVFSIEVWVTLICISILMSITVYLSERVRLRFNPSPKIQLLEVFRIIVNSPIKSLGDATVGKRFLFITFMFFAMIMAFAFQTASTSALITPYDYQDINTLEELEHSKMKILISQWFSEMVPKTSELHKQFVDTQPNDILHYLIDGNRQYGYGITSKDTADLVVGFLTRIHGTQLYHVVQESLIPNVRAYVCLRKSPYVERINQVMFMIEEFGLLLRYDRNATVRHSVDDKSRTTLTLNHLQSAFYLLNAGYILGTMCFIIEVTFRKYRIRKLNKYPYIN